MKNLNGLLAVVANAQLLKLVSMFVLLFGATSATAQSVLEPIYASDDAYLQGSSPVYNNQIRVEGTYRVAFLKFTIPSVNGTVTSAKLRLKVSDDPGSGVIKVNKGVGGNWNNTNLSTANRPANGTQLGEINTSYSIGAVHDITLSITDLGTGVVSLILNHVPGNDTNFYTSEASDENYRPQIIISYAPSSSNVAVTGVSVSPNSATITVGSTQQLTSTVSPSNATNKSVSWLSSNTSVATVSATGTVTAIGAGSANVTVKTNDGNKTSTTAITVAPPAPGNNGEAISIREKNPISSVNGFNNKIEFVNGGHGALVFHPGETDELMFGFHSNGYFYWGTGANASLEHYYSMFLNGNNGNLGIKGRLTANEVKVKSGGWADYVFKKDYQLPSLEEVAQHIKEKGHLINIPSAAEVKANGMELGDMNRLLLEKIEELTLYILEQEKRIIKLEEQ